MLRVLSISAPHWQTKSEKIVSLNSNDPFSLHNTFRVVAEMAEAGDRYWADSNWSTKDGRNNSTLLLQYYEQDKEVFIKKLNELQPNLLFISSMTLGFAGAVAMAKIAKQLLGDKVFVVLGGRHINETMFVRDNKLVLLKNSPLKLMMNRSIERVFDLIVSGEGEYISYGIGVCVCKCLNKQLPLYEVTSLLENEHCPGHYCVAWLDKKESNERYFIGQFGEIDYDRLKSVFELYGTRTKFDVFNADYTAHTMSYLSHGCVFNCYYCSESILVCRNIHQRATAPQRLYNNLKLISSDNSMKASAFIEDSILLGGYSDLISRFRKMLEEEPLPIKFGCQFTIDKLLDQDLQNEIELLSHLGLEYIFVGVETNDNRIADSFSKNLHKKSGFGTSWSEKTAAMLAFVSKCKLKLGVSLLFGLGETQSMRIELLQSIAKWQKKYNNPVVVSMNFAVLHPRCCDESYDYIAWGTDRESAYFELFCDLFGEASERYLLPGVQLPSMQELLEIKHYYSHL